MVYGWYDKFIRKKGSWGTSVNGGFSMNNQTKTFQDKLREQDEQIRKENELQNKMIKWTVILGVAAYVLHLLNS